MLKDLVTSMTMLNGVSQDERQAWERFVKVYKDPMCEFARSQAALHGMSETEAEDAVFTLFERFAQHKEKFDPSKGSLRNWLMMRLKNILLDHVRQRSNEKARIDQMVENGADGESERQRDWKDAHLAIMRRALKRREAPRFEAVVLWYFAGARRPCPEGWDYCVGYCAKAGNMP